MITITGKPVCSGVAFGPVFVFSREESTIKRHHIESSDDEIARFESARQQTISELGMLYDKALAEVGEANAMIFQIHQMLLDALDYLESIKNIIPDQLINAETAVAQTCDNFVQMFRAMDDPYMRERSADVKDVSERLIKILSGKDKDGLVTDEPVIIISDDLAPSETVQFDKSKILAFVTEGGSTNSHTSILARMMNIPAMIGAKGVLSADANGKNAIVDGFTGTIYIDPDEATINEIDVYKRQIFLLSTFCVKSNDVIILFTFSLSLSGMYKIFKSTLPVTFTRPFVISLFVIHDTASSCKIFSISGFTSGTIMSSSTSTCVSPLHET